MFSPHTSQQHAVFPSTKIPRQIAPPKKFFYLILFSKIMRDDTNLHIRHAELGAREEHLNAAKVTTTQKMQLLERELGPHITERL